MSVTVQDGTATTGAARFAALAEALPSDHSLAGRLRRDASARLASIPFPTTRDEDWRFTNIAPVARLAFTLAEPAKVDLSQISEHLIEGVTARLVFVNGLYASALSLMQSDGVTAQPLSAAKDAAEPVIGTLASRDTYFGELNLAFLQDGAYVETKPGAGPATVHLLFVSSPGETPEVISVRNLVKAGAGSEIIVVESYVTLGRGVSLTSATTEVSVGENAKVEHVRLARESDSAHHFGTVAARAERNGTFVSHSVTTGGAITRNDIVATLAGEGASTVLNGLYVAGGQQIVDHHTTIDHAVPHSTSQEFYKGILDGSARGVFDGKIVVRKDAQKTSSGQVNRNLLLSRDAIIDSKPQLEIFADDVKCSHGSTIGQLDEESMFYLRARGIGEEHARNILTLAFAEEVISRIPVEAVRTQLAQYLVRRLPSTAGDTQA